MIERLNSATNLIALVIVAGGCALAFKHPEIAQSVITGGFGLLTGHAIAMVAGKSS
jgi:hypothetical protein